MVLDSAVCTGDGGRGHMSEDMRTADARMPGARMPGARMASAGMAASNTAIGIGWIHFFREARGGGRPYGLPFSGCN